MTRSQDNSATLTTPEFDQARAEAAVRELLLAVGEDPDVTLSHLALTGDDVVSQLGGCRLDRGRGGECAFDLDHRAADLDVDPSMLPTDLGLEMDVVEAEFAVQQQNPYVALNGCLGPDATGLVDEAIH